MTRIEQTAENVETGELDILYDCGCVAECFFERGHLVWHLNYLCEEHDPTIEEPE